MELIVFALIAVLLGWFVAIYNHLVRDKNRVLAAWSDIEVQLKRRYELIPKLVDVVKRYSRHEESLLSDLTKLRNDSQKVSQPRIKGQIEGQLGTKIGGLFALAEAYPDLKTSEQFLSLQQNISSVENDIQLARRYYNGAVRNLNTQIDSFPGLLIARKFGFKQAELFELEFSLEKEPSNWPE
jgi:LemA protein